MKLVLSFFIVVPKQKKYNTIMCLLELMKLCVCTYVCTPTHTLVVYLSTEHLFETVAYTSWKKIRPFHD